MVRCPVVDDNNLQIFHVLQEDTQECFAQVFPDVVAGQDDGQQWRPIGARLGKPQAVLAVQVGGLVPQDSGENIQHLIKRHLLGL